MNLSKLHKLLLVLLLVMLPPWFLVFTDEGRKVSDNVLLWLLGHESIELNLVELGSQYAREDILEAFPEPDWRCEQRPGSFGDSQCVAPIGGFNGFPARQATFFFVDGQVSAFRLDYRAAYHEQIAGYLSTVFGLPVEDPDSRTVLEWSSGGKRVIMKKALNAQDEPALLWFAGR